MTASGNVTSALIFDQRARLLLVSLTGPAATLCTRHQLRGQAAQHAAAGLVATGLLSAHIKGEERLTLFVRSEEPDFTFTADWDADGSVRGLLKPREIPDEPLFTGQLSVVKSLGRRELYRGNSEVILEDFEAALQRYFVSSEQVDGRIRIQTTLSAAGELTGAFGLLVERLPDWNAEEFGRAIEPLLTTPLAELVPGIQAGRLGEQPITVMESREVEFRCSCSRARVEATLVALGPEELTLILEDPGFAEVTCEYCSEIYHLDAAALKQLIAPGSAQV